MPRLPWLLVGLFALVSGGLRAAAMPGAPIWYDETFTLRVIDDDGPDSMWTRIGNTESTPPLSYAICRAFQALGAEGVVAIRLVSVVAAVLVVPVAFWATRRFFGTWVAVAVAGLVALHPMVSFHAINGRSYALLLLLAFLWTGVLGRLLVRVEARWLVAWVGVAIAAAWTHYFALYFMVTGTALLLVLRPEARRAVLVAAGVWAVACLPLLDLITRQSNDERAGQIGSRGLLDRVVFAGRELLGGNPNVSNAAEGLALLIAVAALVLAGLTALRRRGRAPDGSALPVAPEVALAVLAAGIVVMPLALSVASERFDRFFGRNVIVALPAIVMLVAAGLARRRVAGLAALGGLAALMAVGSYVLLFDWRYAQADDQGAIRRAGPEVREFPVLSDVPGQVVVPFLLQRTLAPPDTPVTTARLDVFLTPKRDDTREFAPVPVPAQVAQLQELGFTVAKDELFHAARHLVLQAPAPVALPKGIAPPLGLYLPAPTTDPELQRSLLGDAWG